MVGIFSRFTSYRRSDYFPMDIKESQSPRSDEVGDTVPSGTDGCDHGVELDDEFKPIEHLLEPLDEDRPVKCPMPNSSVLNEWTVESLRKRAELSAAIEEGMVVAAAQPPVDAVQKRHHALSSNQSVSPSFRVPQNKIFQVLEYDAFES
ncbi:uncharacterized protein LOC143863518 isoform X2 [Tasmannia lanceolata]|uniref:uncharacterized protein LOC143863518 isoform X2 n=1 Tax=Tasmannia lanceolata TaxID=3420 RepID=UPI004063D6FB